jgi:MFS family permease
MVFGGLGMASFSVVWTTLALLLSRPPFSYGAGVIGLFGLAGLAGAVAAQTAGRATDRGKASGATGALLAAIAIGWGLIAAGSANIAPLILGIALLDLGIQGQHIINQTLIYGLRPEARSRLTTAYMTWNFACASIGSGLAAAVWDADRWTGVCILGGGLSAIGLLVWLAGRARLVPDVAPGRPVGALKAER